MSGGGGNSGGGSTTTVQKADPWAGLQPYLANLYAGANGATNSQFAGYQGSTVAGLNPSQTSALGRADTRSYGSPLETQAQQLTGSIAGGNDALSGDLANMMAGRDQSGVYLNNVIRGDYLSGKNPYLSAATDAANSDTMRQFQTATMPQLASQFSLSGRYGSGAQVAGISDATNNLAKQISNTNANIYNQNYQNERGLQTQAASQLSSNYLGASQQLGNRQLSATQMLPGMANIDWNNIQKQAAVGDTLQGQQQAELSDYVNRWNQNNQAGVNRLSWMNGILNGGMSLNGQTQTQSNNRSGLSSALGGGLGGAMSGAMMGSVFPGIGTGMGALMGGGLGLLSGLF